VNRHHVIPRKDWFTPEAWAVLEPMIDQMPGDGGCVVLVVDARPDCRNFFEVAAASLTGKERKALRKAMLKMREARGPR
jgi:hypothetical protein